LASADTGLPFGNSIFCTSLVLNGSLYTVTVLSLPLVLNRGGAQAANVMRQLPWHRGRQPAQVFSGSLLNEVHGVPVTEKRLLANADAQRHRGQRGLQAGVRTGPRRSQPTGAHAGGVADRMDLALLADPSRRGGDRMPDTFNRSNVSSAAAVPCKGQRAVEVSNQQSAYRGYRDCSRPDLSKVNSGQWILRPE